MERQFFFNDDDEEREFLLDNKNLICELIVTAIRKSFNEDKDEMEVFTSINSNRDYIMTTQVQRDDWGESLEKCLGYFLGEENYEWCDTMEILKQIESKNKAIRVINSCVTDEQFNSALNYIELYYKRFEDFIGYNELKKNIERQK